MYNIIQYIYIFELSYTKQIIVVVENQWPKMADYDGKFQVKSCGCFSGGVGLQCTYIGIKIRKKVRFWEVALFGPKSKLNGF